MSNASHLLFGGNRQSNGAQDAFSMSEAHGAAAAAAAGAADAAAPLLAEEPALTLRGLKREYLLLRSAVIVSEFLPGKKYESHPR